MTAPHLLSERCRAHNRNGDQCGLAPVRGARVCKWHGGGAPQVREAAEARIRAMVDPALDRLVKLIQDPASPVALAAVKDVLDRAGYGAKQRIDLEIKIRTMAEQMGLDPDEVIAEAQALLREVSASSR